VSAIQVGLSESAFEDLRDIREWYREQQVAEIGDHMVAEILERIDSLAAHPDMGRIVPRFGVRVKTIHLPVHFTHAISVSH